MQLDEVHERLIAVLAEDGRATYAALAERTRTSEPTARRKVNRLLGSGVFRIAVEVDAELLGYQLDTVLWLSVRPAQLARVAGVLAALPGTRRVAVTSGSSNLVASLVSRDVDDLYVGLTTAFGELPEVTQLEVVPVIQMIKRAGDRW
ncbi:hypothetical protein GCM10012275_62930 [Longimycelium tulufanense]|uniref:HTH asnC-type domain-containing protein n=1 Tax=Longimycelium tulufanense TaxID=907463 RepID=A0A8J3FYP2_9PSEU|nr:Lrp/AsnC family transcriptional regulator [Longimycelium tulufanense]GGM83715.1 hypothetical protein GCM10012275_62930 [Longimycelium tulufanense]